MANAADLAKMVPGFEFLQSLMGKAGMGLPQIGQWIAPTLNPQELEKRIDELRAVQFWLEQNARLLATTIQALEVQRMTLSTLQTMNLPLTDLRDALTLTPSSAATPAPIRAAAAPAPPPATRRRVGGAKPAGQAKAPPVDPLQWWGALTQQFTELASKAIADTTADATRRLAGQAVAQSIDSAGETLKKAANMAAAPVRTASRAAGAALAGAAGAAGAVGAGAAKAVGAAAKAKSAEVPRRRRAR